MSVRSPERWVSRTYGRRIGATLSVTFAVTTFGATSALRWWPDAVAGGDDD